MPGQRVWLGHARQGIFCRMMGQGMACTEGQPRGGRVVSIVLYSIYKTPSRNTY